MGRQKKVAKEKATPALRGRLRRPAGGSPRAGAAGLFLAASNFPKSRETRAPLVEELKRFKDRLSPKHQYLADAPAPDPDGHASIVRFSRKTKEQYVMTEVNAKATGWTAHYDNGKWQESLAKSKKA